MSSGELILSRPHVFLAHQMKTTPAYPVRIDTLVRVKHVYSTCLIQVVTSLVTRENKELEKEKTRGKFVKPHNCVISLFSWHSFIAGDIFIYSLRKPVPDFFF